MVPSSPLNMDENPMTTTSPMTNWECKNNLGSIHPPRTCPTNHSGFPNIPSYKIPQLVHGSETYTVITTYVHRDHHIQWALWQLKKSSLNQFKWNSETVGPVCKNYYWNHHLLVPSSPLNMDENPMTTTSPMTNWECKNNLGTIHPPRTCPTNHPGFPNIPSYKIPQFVHGSETYTVITTYLHRDHHILSTMTVKKVKPKPI